MFLVRLEMQSWVMTTEMNDTAAVTGKGPFLVFLPFFQRDCEDTKPFYSHARMVSSLLQGPF